MTDNKRRVGRPKARPGKKYITIAFSLPEELATAIDRAVEDSGMGKSELIRKIISEKISVSGK